ncbi:MAG TPA: AAA family ATPase [Acidobacteriota bacterium]|nr:AAA family ATPase [Acidobacteriota bacterium]
MITSLGVKNFKSLKDVSLKLGPRTVFVGPNMGGKSNLISVFRFLNQLVLGAPGVHGLAHAVNNQGGFAEMAWRGADLNTVAFEIEGVLKGPAEAIPWHYSLDLLGDRARGLVTIQEERLSGKFGDSEVALLETDHRTGRRVIRRASGDTVTEIDDVRRSGLEFELPDWEGNILKHAFATFQFFTLVPHVMKQVNPSSAPSFLTETGNNLSSWLMMLQTRYDQEYARITSALKDVFPEFLNLYTWPTPQATVFLASAERNLKSPVPVWQMSDGELCFIALLSLLFAPEEFGAPLYCIEEPENHLHPRMLKVLVELHDQRQRELDSQVAQLLATTHSPIFVDQLNIADVVVVFKRDGATHCVRPSDKPHLREILASEEMGLGDLIYSGALADE